MVGALVGCVLALGPAVAPAVADPVAGATYTGFATDTAKVTFTVSSDGTIVTSYSIAGIPGSTCDFEAGGPAGVWVGAPISDDAFAYTIGDTISFQGTFTGPQSATGTFRFTQPALGKAPACDSGTVSWTATTTAGGGSGGSGSGGSGGSGSGGSGSGGSGGSGSGGSGSGGSGGSGSGGSGSGGSGSGGSGSGGSGGSGSGGSGGSGSGGSTGLHRHRRAFPTRVALRTLANTRLGGRIGSANAACRAARTVILWRDARRIGSTKSRRDGTYAFATVVNWRTARLWVSVTRRTVRAGVCAAGSSTFIVA